MAQSILITGASGFIGSFLVEKALNNNLNVFAAVRSSSSRKYLKDSRIHFLELNFGNVNELRAALSGHKGTFSKFDYIIHCAGATKCVHSSSFEEANYLQTKTFVETLKELHMTPRQFIFISTLGVYGPIHEKDNAFIQSTDLPQPDTAYGMSKLHAERYLEGVQNFPYVIFRPTGVYGPRETDYYLMAKSIRNHVDFSAGFKQQSITFVYVKDLVNVIFQAIDREVTNRSYCISDGKSYNSKTFSRLIRKELGNPFVIQIKCPLFILKVISLCAEKVAKSLGKSSTLNGDKYKIIKQRNWQCDISPAQRELNYVPRYSLEEGVKETIAWYKQEKWL